MSPKPGVCNRALLCISEFVNEERSEGNMKKDLNFQNILCLSMLYLCISVLINGS
jgi:hypothetical protein